MDHITGWQQTACHTSTNFYSQDSADKDSVFVAKTVYDQDFASYVV